MALVVEVVEHVLHAIGRAFDAHHEARAALQRAEDQLLAQVGGELDVLQEGQRFDAPVLQGHRDAGPAHGLEGFADLFAQVRAEGVRTRHGLPARRIGRIEVQHVDVQLEGLVLLHLGTRHRAHLDQRIDLEDQAVPIGPLAQREALLLAADGDLPRVAVLLHLERQGHATGFARGVREQLGQQLVLQLRAARAQLVDARVRQSGTTELLGDLDQLGARLGDALVVERTVHEALGSTFAEVDAEHLAAGRGGLAFRRAAEHVLRVGVDEPIAVLAARIGHAEAREELEVLHVGTIPTHRRVDDDALDPGAGGLLPELAGLDRIRHDALDLRGQPAPGEHSARGAEGAKQRGEEQRGLGTQLQEQREQRAEHHERAEEHKGRAQPSRRAAKPAEQPALHRAGEGTRFGALEAEVGRGQAVRPAALDEAGDPGLGRVGARVGAGPGHGRFRRHGREERREGALSAQLGQVRQAPGVHQGPRALGVRAVEAQHHDPALLGLGRGVQREASQAGGGEDQEGP